MPTNFWARTHPDQMARYADGSEGDVSLASPEFWADCVDALEALIAHFADPNTPGGDRVIGFHLERGEWFYDAQSGPDLSAPNREAFQHWLQAKYQALYALRASWFDGSVTFEEAEIPLPPAGRGRPRRARCRSTPARVTGAGWTTPSSRPTSSPRPSPAWRRRSRRSRRGGCWSPSPTATPWNSPRATTPDTWRWPRCWRRRTWTSSPGRTPTPAAARAARARSAPRWTRSALHGKLWLVEDDTKTFLADDETPDTYNPKIAGGADTQAAHQRQFGAALAHGAGVTWMDLWGQGWLDSPDIWQELRGLREQADLWGRITAGRQAPDVAVLVDEASLAYFKNDPAGLGQSLIGKTRDLLLRAGASVGFYLQSDVTQADFPDAKLYLFLNALRVTTAERQAIREKLQRPGKTLAWLYAPAVFDEKGRGDPGEQRAGRDGPAAPALERPPGQPDHRGPPPDHGAAAQQQESRAGRDRSTRPSPSATRRRRCWPSTRPTAPRRWPSGNTPTAGSRSSSATRT